LTVYNVSVIIYDITYLHVVRTVVPLCADCVNCV